MLKKKKRKKYNALKLDVLCLGRVIAKSVGLKGGCRLVKSRGSGKEEEKTSGTNGEFQKAERTESVTKRDGDTSTPLGRDRNSRQPMLRPLLSSLDTLATPLCGLRFM